MKLFFQQGPDIVPCDPPACPLILQPHHRRLKLGLLGRRQETVIAAITRDSVAKLGLQVGKALIYLVKAPQIILMTDFGGYQLSARNQLPGVVTQVKPGAVNAEVDIELKGGEKLAATGTNGSLEKLGLKKGQAVTAVFLVVHSLTFKSQAQTLIAALYAVNEYLSYSSIRYSRNYC